MTVSWSLSRFTLCGLYALFTSMLQPIYVSFLVEHYVRQELRRGTLSMPLANTEDTNAVSTPLRFQLWWGSLGLLLLSQAGAVVWNVMRDVQLGSTGDLALSATYNNSTSSNTSSSLAARRSTRHQVLAGPLWALCFTALWWPVPYMPFAVHLVLGSVLYESTMQGCSNVFRELLSQVATHASEQERNAVSMMTLLCLAGTVGVGLGQLCDEQPSQSYMFRAFTTLWALIAGCGLAFCGRALRVVGRGRCSNVDGVTTTATTTSSSPNRNPVTSSTSACGTKPLEEGQPMAYTRHRFWSFVMQTTHRPCMRAMLVLWPLQEYNRTLLSHFFITWLALLSARGLSLAVRAFLLTVACALPHLVGMLPVQPLLLLLDKRDAVYALLLLRLVLALALLVLGIRLRRRLHRYTRLTTTTTTVAVVTSNEQMLLCLLLMLTRWLIEALRQMQDYVFCDVTDEDTVIFGRATAMPMAMSALLSLVSRPLHALALITGCLFLFSHGTALVHVQRHLLDIPTTLDNGNSSSSEKSGAQVMALSLMLIVPTTLFLAINTLVCTTTMLMAWHKYYNLAGAHLRFVQLAVQKRREEQNVKTV